ncbi:hypothetical protein [Dawidia soli]|uniref:Uncharacterized protein n=1 Tax=Dawidia soli TaxID=2782352 RepID=A0AAP2DCJ2_9BACT|nr:hypothetical protein [Dawidia soli]MBT1689229.1 hypothetical protein [Dawidia soli]
MARQKSIIKLEGEIGDISFYKTQDGYLAREKTSHSGERIKTDPAFARVRENMSEFARAGQAAKVVSSALRSLIVNAKAYRMTSRLTKEFSRIIRTDAVNLRGQRTATDGEVGLLNGFNFNNKATLGSTFYPLIAPAIDRAAGTATIAVQEFSPTKMVIAPEGATHFRLIAGMARVNFETGDYALGQTASEQIQVNSVANVQAQLVSNLAGITGGDTLLLAFGIEYSQLVNGQQYPLNNGSFNALAIVAVNREG